MLERDGEVWGGPGLWSSGCREDGTKASTVCKFGKSMCLCTMELLVFRVCNLILQGHWCIFRLIWGLELRVYNKV